MQQEPVRAPGTPDPVLRRLILAGVAADSAVIGITLIVPMLLLSSQAYADLMVVFVVQCALGFILTSLWLAAGLVLKGRARLPGA
jgi:hypothetical protein